MTHLTTNFETIDKNKTIGTVGKTFNIFGKDGIDENAIQQFSECMIQPFAVKGALMPDAHYGYAMPIGGVIATENVIVPSWVGNDIGCGVSSYKVSGIKKKDIVGHEENIMKEIQKRIPAGQSKNNRDNGFHTEHNTLTNTLADFYKQGFVKGATSVGKHAIANNLSSDIGTLGGGNHFVEIGYDESDDIYIIVHSGSRGLGGKVAQYYMNEAYKISTGMLIKPGKNAPLGSFGLNTNTVIGKEYVRDLKMSQTFALYNRYLMIQRTLLAIAEFVDVEQKFLDPINELTEKHETDGVFINRHHNHAYQDDDGLWIHRKGATHSEKDMLGVIPGNMRDGSFIIRGKGNEESLCSSSHGAGRVLGRNQAKRQISLDDFHDMMKDSEVCATIDENTIEESPVAYKNIFDVLENQKELIEIVHQIKPLINIKG